MSSKKIETLSLKGLRASSKTQVRVALNEEALESYRDAAKEWKEKGVTPEFPPLVVFRDDKGDHLADGFTRRVALQDAGYTEYDCEIKDGSSLDAFLYGCVINQAHGARLSNKDKSNILEIALADKELVKLSTNALAMTLGLTTNFVQRKRPKSTIPGEVQVKRKGGKVTTMKTAGIGKKGGKKGKDKPKSEKAQAKAAASVSAAVNKIATAIGGKEGEQVRTALNTGKLNIPIKELKTWSETSGARIAKIGALVTGIALTPSQAVKAIDKVIKETSKIEDACVLCLAGNGVAHEKIEGTDFKIVVYDPKKASVEVTLKD